MFWLSPQSAEPITNTTSAPWSTTFRPYMSPSFPATGVVIVDASRYAVTTHDSFSIPPRLPTIVGNAVDTIVESSDAISITSISAAKTGPTRCAAGADERVLATTLIDVMLPRSHVVIRARDRAGAAPRDYASSRERPVMADGCSRPSRS